MPIYLDWLDEPNEQDRIDLDKLYLDAPEQWQQDNGQPLNAHWAAAHVNPQTKLAMGRFNDRVVAAVWLIQQSETSSQSYQFTLDKLCVRKITRQRGVAKQLIVRLCQWAKVQECSLYIEDADERLAGLYELGFVQYESGWRFQGNLG